ncbi:hypothetical protein KAI78_06635 [bacterium]|nr:hypothetical protein [bacterium]
MVSALIITTSAAVVLGVMVIMMALSKKESVQRSFYPMIDKIREIGELSFYRLYSKELIVESGKKGGSGFLSLLKKIVVSEKRIIMMMEFVSDFKINLRDPDFHIESSPEEGVVTFYLPTLFYSTHVSEIQFLDEKEMKFLPGILPPIINPGIKISVEERNILIQEGKEKIMSNVELFLKNNRSDIEKSLQDTLRGIAAGFGISVVRFRPSHSSPLMVGMDTEIFDELVKTK